MSYYYGCAVLFGQVVYLAVLDYLCTSVQQAELSKMKAERQEELIKAMAAKMGDYKSDYPSWYARHAFHPIHILLATFSATAPPPHKPGLPLVAIPNPQCSACGAGEVRRAVFPSPHV